MECGGFSSRPVYGLKHVPDTRYGHGVLAEEKKKVEERSLVTSAKRNIGDCLLLFIPGCF